MKLPSTKFRYVGTNTGPWEICKRFSDPGRGCENEACERAHYCSNCGFYQHPSWRCQFWPKEQTVFQELVPETDLPAKHKKKKAKARRSGASRPSTGSRNSQKRR